MAQAFWDNTTLDSVAIEQPWAEEGSQYQLYETPMAGNFSANQLDWENVLDEFRASLYNYSQPSTIILLCFYVPIFLFALSGNIMVFLIIVGNKNMRSVTNYFLLNLAIADLLVTVVCIPLTVGETVYRAWVYGEFLCKATAYLQGVCISASVLTIMALSIDRYVAIRHPVKSRRLSTKTHVKIAIVLIWFLASSIMVPLAVVRTLSKDTIIGNEHYSYCHEKWPDYRSRRSFDIFLFVFIYVIPGVVVTSSYSATGCHLLASEELLQRQDSDVYQSYKIMAGRRRVARMLLILAILFAVSWMPYHAVSLYINFSSKRDVGNLLMTLSFALMLGQSHSAQNPILYCLTNNSFKRGMVGLLRCKKTNLSDFTRASARSDPRADRRRCQSERLSEAKRRAGFGRRGSDGCIVTANPMVTKPRRDRMYLPHNGPSSRTTLPSTSEEEDSRAREAIPLMEMGKGDEQRVGTPPRDIRYGSSLVSTPPALLVNCRVEVTSNGTASSPPRTRTLVSKEDPCEQINNHVTWRDSSVARYEVKTSANGHVPELRAPGELISPSGSKHSVCSLTRGGDLRHITVQAPGTDLL